MLGTPPFCRVRLSCPIEKAVSFGPNPFEVISLTFEILPFDKVTGFLDMRGGAIRDT